MRKITLEACTAFMNMKSKVLSNTTVSVESIQHGLPVVISMYLFGNKIATYYRVTNTLEITNCGWFSNTTLERLNGLPGVLIHRRKGIWHLNGEVWDGSLKKIKLERNDSN